jgi:hypothetical protein
VLRGILPICNINKNKETDEYQLILLTVEDIYCSMNQRLCYSHKHDLGEVIAVVLEKAGTQQTEGGLGCCINLGRSLTPNR